MTIYSGSIAQALNVNISGTTGAPAMVLAHGFGLDQSVWQYVVPYLALYFKVLVFDLAFAGNVQPPIYNAGKYSTFDGYAQDLVQLMKEKKVTDAIFVGHSMSAMIGCIAATQKPYLFRRLILLNGSPRYLNATNYNGGFSLSDVYNLLQSMQRNYTVWAPAFAASIVAVNDTNAITMFQRSLLRMKPSVAVDVARVVFLTDNRRVLSFIPARIPITIIQSKDDFVVPLSVPYYMKRMLRGNATVEILNQKGHIPQLTAPSLLLGVLGRVLGFP